MSVAHTLCNALLACGLKGLGYDLRRLHVSAVRPLQSGGLIVILEPIDDPDYGREQRRRAA